MSEARAQKSERRGRGRRPRRLLLWVLVTLFVVAGAAGLALGGRYLYRSQQSRRSIAELAQAEAEVDQLDPNWRLEEVEARRPTLAPEENAAEVVLRLAQSVPADVRAPKADEPLRLPEPPNRALSATELKRF